ncbi:MAG: hypothetical protein J5807_04640 [Kiritimatiellae bacterium]|nr:hypothetical protein [Kiritimatiellia bacterium]
MNSYIRLRNCIAFLIAIAFALPLFSADKYWTGAAGANASLAGSWCDDAALTVVSTAAPTTGDDIHLTSGAVAMTWNLNVSVASWEQDGYTGTVTFQTGKKNGMTTTLYGYTTDNETYVLKVTGDVVVNSGKWQITQQPNYNTTALKGTAAYTTGQGNYRLILEADGDVTIGANATFNAKSLGFRASQGPGAGSGNINSATHGGMGSWNTSSSSMKCYGVISAPITQGSGAGNGAGGGAVTIISGGAVTVDGTIDSSGADGGSYHIGAGGSIFIEAQSFSGTGTLNANGGAGKGGHDQGGGGGRIGIKLTGDGEDFEGFTGVIKAKLGKKSANDKSEGGGGTIYLETKADGAGCGTLIIDGCEGGFAYNSLAFSATILDADNFDVTPKKIVMRPEAKLILNFDGVYEPPELVQESESGYNVLGYICPAASCTLKIDEMIPSPLAMNIAGGAIKVGENGTGTLVIGSGQTIYVNNTVQLYGNLTIASGGKLTHYSKPDSSHMMNLTVNGNFTVQSGGNVTANSLGNNPAGTPGDGGGSYGGRAAETTRPCCYGSVRHPVHLGARGQGKTGVGNGGGAIRITATGAMTVDGTVSSNGSSVDYRCGSGGSVYLTAASISGAGTITANGGTRTATGSSYNPGGGGRIAIHLTGAGQDFGNFTGTITAYGGKYKSGTYAGGAGTIYLKTGDQADDEGTVIIENGSTTGEYTDFMNGAQYQTVAMTDLAFGDVVVRNAKVCISNTTVSVKRGWNTASGSTLSGLTDGILAVTGTDDAYFYGLNTFYGFRCEVPDKTIYFGTGSTNKLTVADGGLFALAGAIGTNVVVRSAVPGEDWSIKVPVTTLSECTVENVTAESSDASTGEEIVALNSHEITNGSCTNWRFVNASAGQENTWLGVTGSTWLEPSNWSLGRAPIASDLITIAASQNDPELSATAEFVSLAIESGATLRLCGYSMSVADSLVVHGAIEASDTERIETTATNIVMDSGALVPARGTFAIVGDGDQTVALNADFWNLTLQKSGGTVAWSGSSSVERVLSLSASAATAVSFASGSSLAANEFRANGVVGGNAALTLSGSWALDASRLATATGVRIGGCDASSGCKLFVYAPFENLGGNLNCDFGTDSESRLFIWTGAADSAFSNPANWQGRDNEAPGANDIAMIASAASITVSSDVELGGLWLDGSQGAVTFTSRGELSVADAIYVGTNATLCIDAPTSAGYVQVDYSGKITHTARDSAGTYKVNLTVTGDMLVREGGSVNGNGKGYAVDTGTACGKAGVAAAHGGCGTYYNAPEKHRLGYGSFVNPVTYGSGGYSTGGSGGGVVIIDIAGTLVNDGTISANAGASTAKLYTASGGSVNIKCGVLKGRGNFTAHGGYASSATYEYLFGAGGRISITQRTGNDFSQFTGRAYAYGGRVYPTLLTYYVPCGNSGHVTWILPDSKPHIVVENNGYVLQNSFGVTLPAVNGDSARVMRSYDFELKNGGRLYIVDDVTIYDLTLATANTKIFLNGHTLRILSHAHKNRAGWSGTVDTGTGGQIIWVPTGLSVTVR